MIFLNAAEFLKEAVESVLAQSYPHWELLLVDDGSNDGSSEIAQFFATHHPSRILYLEHEGHQNLGMSASRNLGILNAKGDYIAFLDADDYWLPTRLEAHVKVLDSHPMAGMLYGSTKYWFSWTGQAEDYQRDHLPERRVLSETLFSPPQLLIQFLERKIEIPATCSLLVRSDVIRNVGGFEESFRGMYEDQAFYTKICLSVPVLAINDCLAWYRQHPKSHCSIATRSDPSHSLHVSFLKWVESYCQLKNVTDIGILQAVRRQLWLYYNRPAWLADHVSPNNLRWIKKWILRVEEFIIPSPIRNWLWSSPHR